jgi:uncharacterized protein
MQRRLRYEYPAGVPCWVDVTAPDPAGAARFYEGLFGWEIEERSAGYLVARQRGADVAGIGSLVPDSPVAWHTYIRVDSAGEAAAKVTGAGGKVLRDAYETPGIARVALCADPAGAEFRLYEPAGLAGAQAVNEGGSWNFNELNTTDFDGSTAFYGAVFGWEASPLEFAGQSFTMWTRPGYGDFLETIDPGVRRRHQEGGAPPSFTDAVGCSSPPPGPSRTGASRSRSTIRTPSPPWPSGWAVRCWCRRSTPARRGSPCYATRRVPCSRPTITAADNPFAGDRPGALAYKA